MIECAVTVSRYRVSGYVNLGGHVLSQELSGFFKINIDLITHPLHYMICCCLRSSASISLVSTVGHRLSISRQERSQMERCSFSMHYTRVSDAQQVCIVSRQRRWPGLHPCCSTCSYLFPFLSLSLCVYVISQYMNVIPVTP